jgi:hypothetical protein
MATMPGTEAQRGDVYRVDRDATLDRDPKPGPRPMVCVAEQPHDDLAWRAMARTTTAFDPSLDLPSPADPATGMTAEGWWSYRFLRSVKKRWTGRNDVCAYLGTLRDPVKSDVLRHYMSRPKARPRNDA